MRITLLGNNDVASNLAFNLLIRALPMHQYRLFLSPSVGAKTTTPDALLSLKFFEQDLFNRLLFPALQKAKGADETDLKPFANLLPGSGKVQLVSHINDKNSVDQIAAGKPELIVSIRFGQILKEQIIDLPEYGVLNLHSGILPDYRGVMATFWAMLNGEQEIGTTLHYISDPQVDRGNIVAIHRQPVNYQNSYLSNVLALYPAGIAELVSAISMIEDKQSPPSLQPEQTGQYYGFPGQSQLDAFKAKGLKLFDYAEIIEFAERYLKSAS